MSDYDYERCLRRAIELTADCPDLPFGAVIVHRLTSRVVAEGWNRTHENPTWHGEFDGINQLMAVLPALDPTELILYTTAEPCPMCQGRCSGAHRDGSIWGVDPLPRRQRLGAGQDPGRGNRPPGPRNAVWCARRVT